MLSGEQRAGVQQALNSFFHWAKLGVGPALEADGVIGRKTRARVSTAMFYLGYGHGILPRNDGEWSRLVRRLRHPKSGRWLNPASLVRGIRRRRARRKALQGS